MPLLGRSKSSSKRTEEQAAPASCQSPLFGLRRQLQQPDMKRATQQVATPKELSSVPLQISREQVHYAFGMMDADRDGMIDLRDLSHMVANLGLPIDEAILAHIISSSVSKRGDHRISEAEFLDWLAQITEVTSGRQQVLSSKGSAHKSRSQGTKSCSSKKQDGNNNNFKTRALITEPEEQANWFSRGRRGSGSGLALMRSLSGSSIGASQSPVGSPATSSTSGRRKSRELSKSESSQGSDSAVELDEREAAQLEEARNDLKAAFGVFDLDGDGYITVDEVQSGLKLIGETWTQAEIRQVFLTTSTSSSSFAQQQQQIPSSKETKLRSSSKSRIHQSPTTSSPSDLNSKRISIDDFVRLLL